MIEFTESFYGRENPELKRTILPGELPGIANRCLAAYRRLLREGKFIQPTSGLVLLGKVRAAATPYAAFMDTYWEPDPKGDGTLIGVFEQTFREWAIQNEAFGIADTSTSNLIQEINKVPEWGWLVSYRPAKNDQGKNEPRRYRVKLKRGASFPDPVKQWILEWEKAHPGQQA